MNAEMGVAAIDRIDARPGEQQLARVEEILLLGVAGKGVPAILRMELEEADVIGNFFCWIVFPRSPFNGVRHEWADHGAGFENQLARFNPELHAVFPQTQAAAA